MSLPVKLSRRAALDIARTFNWLTDNRSLAAAMNWRNKVEAALRKLAILAVSCPEAPEAEWLGSDLRQFLHGRRPNVYRILFRIRNETIEILRIRHARQELLGPDDL